MRAFFVGTPSISPADLVAHGSGWLRKAQNVEERKLDEAPYISKHDHLASKRSETQRLEQQNLRTDSINTMTITTQQVEASWKALTSWWTPQRSLFEDETADPEDRDEIKRVLKVFASDREANPAPSFVSGEHCTPKLVAEFVAGLAQRHNPKSLLDPACGYGLLLATAAAASEAPILRGIEINIDIANRASTIWGEALELTKGEALFCLEEHDGEYDMIVSDPPLSLRLSESQLRALEHKTAGRDFSSALILSCLKKLAPGGIAVFTVAPSFLLDRQKEAFLRHLHQAGFRISACLQVPSGTRHNTTISTYAVVFEAGEQGQIFIGQLKDDTEHLRHLINNLYRRKPKGDLIR